jgi:hypothetical protein
VRNKALEELGILVGDWALTVSDAWFLDPGTEVACSPEANEETYCLYASF